MQVWSLDQEMATHSSILTWKIPWTEEPGRLHSMGSHACESLCKGFSVATRPHLFIYMCWSLILLVFVGIAFSGWLTAAFIVVQLMAHWVSDNIQLFHPLSPPSPPALNLSQHQGLFQWIADCPTVTLKSTLVSLHPRWDQFSSVTQSCRTLCNPMNCSTPGLPIGEGSGTPLQYSCLESPMDGRAC